MGIKQNVTLSFSFALVAIVSFAIGIAAVLGFQYFWNETMHHEVKILKDIDFSRDNIFNDNSNFKTKIEGSVKKGSIGEQTFRKGNAVYIQFPIALKEDCIEYVKQST